MLRRNFLKAAAGLLAGIGAVVTGRTLSLAKGELAIPDASKFSFRHPLWNLDGSPGGYYVYSEMPGYPGFRYRIYDEHGEFVAWSSHQPGDPYGLASQYPDPDDLRRATVEHENRLIEELIGKLQSRHA